MAIRPRNLAARSPLMRKGGVHQRNRSGERQQEKRALARELDVWTKEEDESLKSTEVVPHAGQKPAP